MELSSQSVLSYTDKYLTVDGKPWFPVMGEIHYSRLQPDDWERELWKMKNGGVDVVSAYTIWIHHEEIEGEWNFSGCRDLRRFLSEVKKCGLYCFLRIGPWAHGECRNGGFPDWLVKKQEAATEAGEVTEDGEAVPCSDQANKRKMVLRSNDPEYLSYVRRFYEKIYEQAKGYFLKEDGPIIGIQIENEYGHCGGFTGPEGEEHMRTLQKMAREIGFDVPLWTATGWGGAVTGGMLPVMGGYCEAPWDPRTTEIEPSGNYIFTRERNDHAIGSDHGLGEDITFDMNKFPYLTAELGGGLQVTAHRRPIATGKDTEAMSLVKLGSGCNLLGYYMYHGGTNPEGKKTTLQESKETGYPNDLPVLSYDFNAPLKEYGQITDTWRRIRRLSLFLHDFGSELCEMEYIPQPGNPSDPGDLSSLRTAVRCLADGSKGYLFVNNYVRRQVMKNHPDTELKAYGPDGRVLADFGKVDIEDGDYFFFPFETEVCEKDHEENRGMCQQRKSGMEDGKDHKNSRHLAAPITPLCLLNEGKSQETVYVAYGHDRPGKEQQGLKQTYVHDRMGRECFDLKQTLAPEVADRLNREGMRLLLLTEEESLHACKADIGGREYLLISSGDVIREENGALSVRMEGKKDEELFLYSYPELPSTPEGFEKEKREQHPGTLLDTTDMTLYTRKLDFIPSLRAELTLHDTPESEELHALLHVEGIMPEMEEAMVVLEYEGLSAEMRQIPPASGATLRKDRRAADSFYTGQPWEIGVKRFAGADGCADFFVVVHPLRKEEAVYLQKWPDMSKGYACTIRGLRVAEIRRIPLRFA